MSEAVKSTRFAWLRSIEPNAVLVKDLRQAARNWSVTGAVLLMMAIFFIVSLAFLLGDEMAGRGNYLGAQLFASIAGVMMTVTFIFLPIYVGIRSMAERSSASADLLYITTMSPARIIAGKFLSGAALVGIFYTAALPFMVFSYLLRGVDLPTILLTVSFLYMINCLLLLAAMMLASMGIHLIFKILIALFIGLPIIINTIVIVLAAGAFSSLGGALTGGRFWEEALPLILTILLNIGLAAGLLFFLCVSFITPRTANREFPLRVYCAVMWAVIGLEAGVWTLVKDDWEIFGYVFGAFCGLLGALGIFYAIGQEDHLSVRVRRDIPRNPLRRAVAFLFFNGALGGLILSCLFSFGGLLLIFASLEAWPMLTGSSSSTHDWSEFCSGFIILGLYLIAHALMSLWIHRTWLPTRSPMWPRLFFLLSIGIPYCATFVIYYLFTQDFLEDGTIPGIMLNSFYAIADGDEESVYAHLIAALVLAVGALVLNAKWIFERLKDFKPYERPTTPVPPTPPVTQTAPAANENPIPPKLG
jgi:hypothetical protein